MSIRPNKSQTSTGDFLVHCFDLTMSDSSLSLTTNWGEFPQHKLIALIKCLLILQALPEDALDESVTQLEDIASFYSNRNCDLIVPVIPASSIKGKLKSTQIRPPIVLEQ